MCIKFRFKQNKYKLALLCDIQANIHSGGHCSQESPGFRSVSLVSSLLCGLIDFHGTERESIRVCWLFDTTDRLGEIPRSQSITCKLFRLEENASATNAGAASWPGVLMGSHGRYIVKCVICGASKRRRIGRSRRIDTYTVEPVVLDA